MPPAASMHSRPTMLRAQPRPSLCIRQIVFGFENALAAQRLDVQQEVLLLAEQAEAVLDLPDDAVGGIGRRLRGGAASP